MQCPRLGIIRDVETLPLRQKHLCLLEVITEEEWESGEFLRWCGVAHADRLSKWCTECAIYEDAAAPSQQDEEDIHEIAIG